MDIQIRFISHVLPLWFLILALFLPRLSIAILWFENALGHFHLHGLLPPIFWLILPRALVLYLIYVDQGISLWFIIHFVAAIMMWGGSTHYHTRRRRRDSI
jgi:hypothetical protein